MIRSADNPPGLSQAIAPVLPKTLSVLLFGFGLLAFIGSVFLWGEGFILHPPEGVSTALPLADLLINAPVSIFAATDIWQGILWLAFT